jgi:hypothetical protein
MDVNQILQKPEAPRIFTGLTPQEFNDPAPTFAQVWREHTRRKNIN